MQCAHVLIQGVIPLFRRRAGLQAQVSGAKHLILYPPHQNEDLYEGHLAEAELSYDPSTHVFRRDKLLESTSMVRLVPSQARARLIHSQNVAMALNISLPARCKLGPNTGDEPSRPYHAGFRAIPSLCQRAATQLRDPPG